MTEPAGTDPSLAPAQVSWRIPAVEGERAEALGKLWTLENAHGVRVQILERGVTLVAVETPDRAGRLGNIVLSYPDLSHFAENPHYLGCVVGRYANRIANGELVLGGKIFRLDQNEGLHTLHGGAGGLHTRLWAGTATPTASGEALVFRLHSPHLDQGFPGAVDLEVTFTLTAANRLDIAYRAVSSQTTVLSLSQHSYFNLAGHGTIFDHQFELAADRLLEVDAAMIPTGAVQAVAGTVFDFNQPRRLGDVLSPLDEALNAVGGFDHNYCLACSDGVAARLTDLDSGRTLTIETDQPGLQVYTGQKLTWPPTNGQAETAHPFGGIALEPQQWPDAPHHPDFPSAIVAAGEVWQANISYGFGVLD